MKELKSHLPQNSFPLIKKWIKELNILVRIKKRRFTKLGDFSINKKGQCVISINNDLNKYSFLITLTHEIAHAFVWKEYKNKVLPHGKEWKTTFTRIMLNFLDNDIFPDDILRSVSRHLINPKASTANDYELSLILRKYDPTQATTISDIPEGSTFTIRNGKKFTKLRKLRKRYKCKTLSSNKIYLFNPLTIVNLSSNNLD